jgi:hypothetical protein
VVLGFGILLGLCVAGLIAALAGWVRAKNREDALTEDERDDSAKESGVQDEDVDNDA